MGLGYTQKVKEIGSDASYYNEYTTTNLYVELAFGDYISTLTVTNDSGNTDPVQVSYDGATLEADIKDGESLTLKTDARTSVYIKATTGGDNARIWGW